MIWIRVIFLLIGNAFFRSTATNIAGSEFPTPPVTLEKCWVLVLHCLFGFTSFFLGVISFIFVEFVLCFIVFTLRCIVFAGIGEP